MVKASIQIQDKILSLQEDTKADDLTNWLQSNYSQVQDEFDYNSGRLINDTLGWVLKIPDFQAWYSDGDALPLWILGPPGIGKSMMAAFIINHIGKDATMATSPLVAYYFFGNRAVLQPETTMDIIRTLAHHCTKSDPNFRHEVANFKSEVGTILPRKNLRPHYFVTGLLSKPLDSANRMLYIILDGLNELHKPEKDDIKSLITTLSSLPSVRLLVLGRPHYFPVINPDLERHKAVTFEDNKDDIRLYIEEQVRIKLGSKENARDPRRGWFKQIAGSTIEEFLYEKGEGIYLWVDKVLEMIVDSARKDLPTVYQNALRSDGKLNPIYANILEGYAPKVYNAGETRSAVGNGGRWPDSQRRST